MFVGLDVLFGLNTPKLQVPTDFKVKSNKSLYGGVAENISSPTWDITVMTWGVLAGRAQSK